MSHDPVMPLPAAERMRRHRERRKNKLRCLTIEIRESEIEALRAPRKIPLAKSLRI
jgi:hypothetical protein